MAEPEVNTNAEDKLASNRQAFRRYYSAHKEEVQARIRAYRDNDPDGSKAHAQKLYVKKHHYKKAPTPQKALSLYAAQHGISVAEISIPVAQVISEINSQLGIAEQTN